MCLGLQEEVGFSFANKLKKKHLLWGKHKMNVKLAVQTLSLSVVTAIDFFEEAQLPEFQGSEATCEFMKRMDCAFDFLNSRNPFAKGTKQPITHSYFAQWSSECDKLVTYIFNLKIER